MTESTFKMTKREKCVLAANRLAMTESTIDPVPLETLEIDLAKIVELKNRWQERIGWKPGDEVNNRLHRVLLDASMDIWKALHS